VEDKKKKKKAKVKAKDKKYVVADGRCLFCKSMVYRERDQVMAKDLHNGGPDIHKLVKAGTLVEVE
jgi:hypothetical protein